MPSNANDTDEGNQGEDENKTRSRVSKACTRCRTRKDRCDGSRPACSACLTARKECFYEVTSKKRGLPEGYVRGLEKLLAIATHSITGLEDTLVELLNNDALRRNWNTAAAEDFHSTYWKDSKTQRELEALLSDVSITVAGQKRKRGDGEEQDSPELTDVITSELGTRYCVGKEQTINRSASNSTLAVSVQRQTLPDNARNLIDHYFTFVHCWFPVLNRPHVLRSFYAMSRSQHTIGYGTAIIWAIFAYTVVILPENDIVQSRQLSSEYRQIALGIINAALVKDQVSDQDNFACAQSLLLLSMLDLGNRHVHSAWIHIGAANRLASLRSKTGELTVDDNTVRCFEQGAFILGTAILLELPTKIRSEPARLVSGTFSAEDGHDEWEPWNLAGSSNSEVEPSFSFSVFNRSTRVFKVLAEISSNNDSTLNSTVVELHLENLHNARRNDSFARLADPSIDSPPHHVFFMMFHLITQLHLVAIPASHTTGPVERARLACNVVGLLEICASSSRFALSHVPPLLSTALSIACEQALAVASAFGDQNALPSLHDFSKAISGYKNVLANVWPIFEKDSGLDQLCATGGALVVDSPVVGGAYTATPASARSTNQGFVSQLAPDMDPNFFAQQIESPHIGHPSFDVSNQMSRQARNESIGSAYNASHHGQSPASFPQAARSLQGSAITDFAAQGLPHSETMSIVAPEAMMWPTTSPSHQGDAIDAIFNEMAYLDTNDWNTERTSDLRDFGFNDDMAFQAFCNDPERVNVTAGLSYMPLSSSRKSWNFSGQIDGNVPP